MKNSICGFLNIHKPAGITSHDVIYKLRQWTGIKRIGHAGTLDPAATGVLPVALGTASRLIAYLPSQKVYLAEILLGTSTTTDDLCGSVIEQKYVPSSLNQSEIESVLSNYTGEFQQKPPLYSAVRRNGQRLYARARQQLEIRPKQLNTTAQLDTMDSAASPLDIISPAAAAPALLLATNVADMLADVETRSVHVERIELLHTNLPVLQLRIFCSSGTYIRALARDIGQALGCGACLKSLCREQSGIFTIETALHLNLVESLIKDGQLQKILLTPDIAFEEKLIEVDLPTAILIAQGGSPSLETAAANLAHQHCLVVYQANSIAQHPEPVAICVLTDDKLIRPKVVLVSPSDLH